MAKHINPYVAGAPVTDQRMFFGREDVFTWIEQNIGGQFSENMLVLHGQRRVGKTSVLKQLGNHISDNYIPVFFDFQGRTNTTINRFLYRLAREIVRTLSREHGIKIPQPDREAFERDAEHFAGTFLSQVREILGERNLVLVFDEFDTLEERTARDMLGQYLVPYFSRMVHGAEKLNFIFSIGSSGHKLEDMRAEYTDFFRASLYKRISFLDAANSRRLIIEPVREIMAYEDQAVERIIEVTSGHPYFTQLLCHELFARAQRTDDWLINLSDVEEVLPDVIERGTVNLKFVWDVSSSTERYTLATLAEMGREGSKEEILSLLRENKVRISAEEIGQALLELTSRDVLSKEHGFTVELLRLWLLENRPLKRVVEELAEKHPVAVRHTQIAEEYREQDQIEQALENYHSALAVAPNYNPAHLGIAEIYQETGRWLEAVEVYKKIIVLDSKESRAKIGLCESFVALGDAARDIEELLGAIVRYQEALGVDDAYIEARERLAAIYLSQAKELVAKKKWKSAGESLLEAWNYIPTGIEIEGYPDPPLNIDQLDGVEELENAIAPLRKALSTMRAQLAREELARAVQLREGEQYSAALAKLERALAYEADLEEIQKEIKITRDAEREEGGEKIYTSGKKALGAQRWGEAINTFQRYLELAPEDSRQVKKVKDWIEEARLQEELAERYAAARQTIERGVTRRAITLLTEIKDLEDNYRDAEQLLDEAKRKWRGNLFGKAALWGVGIVLLGVLGWWLLKPDAATEVPISIDKTPISGYATSVPEIDVADAVDSIIQIALDAIQNQEPTYQTSFDSWDFGEPVENASLENGNLRISNETWNTYVPLGRFNFNSEQFATEFRLQLLEYEQDGSCIVNFSSNDIGLRTLLSTDGEVRVDHPGADGDVIVGSGKFDLSNANTATIIVLKDQVSLFVDGQLAFTALHPEGSTAYTSVGLEASNSITCQFDNYKFWDLSDVDFENQNETSTTTPVPLAWKRLNSAQFITRDTVTAIVIDPSDPDVWYAGTNSGGIYKSINGGISWLPAQNGLGRASIDTLILDPTNSDTLYAGTLLGGVYKTVDGGENWQNVSQGIRLGNHAGPPPPGDIAIDPQNSLHLFFTNGNAIYESENGAKSWSEIPLDAVIGGCGNPQRLRFSPIDPQTLFILSGGPQVSCGGVFKSSDGGESWAPTELATVGIFWDDMWIDKVSGNYIFALSGSMGEHTLSSDGGETWQEVTGQWCQELAFHPDDEATAYCGFFFGRGIARTTNGGQSWQNIGEIETEDFGSMLLAPHNPNIILAGGDGLFLSTDGGYTWEERSSGLGSIHYNIYANPINSSNWLYALEDRRSYASLYRSSDGGKTWEFVDAQGHSGLAFDADGQTLYRPWNEGSTKTTAILISHDRGETWELSPYLPSNIIHMFAVGADPYMSGKIYVDVMSSEEGFPNQSYFSLDGGESWEKATMESFIGYQQSQFIGSGLSSYLVNTQAIDPQNPDTIYAGTDNGAYISFDGGKHWAPINDGLLGGLVVYSIVIDEESNVYAATPLGIFKLVEQ